MAAPGPAPALMAPWQTSPASPVQEVTVIWDLNNKNIFLNFSDSHPDVENGCHCPEGYEESKINISRIK